MIIIIAVLELFKLNPIKLKNPLQKDTRLEQSQLPIRCIMVVDLRIQTSSTIDLIQTIITAQEQRILAPNHCKRRSIQLRGPMIKKGHYSLQRQVWS